MKRTEPSLFRLLFIACLLLGAAVVPSAVAQDRGKKGKKGDKKGETENTSSGPAEMDATATLVLEDGRLREGVDVKEEKFKAFKIRDRGRNEELEGQKILEVRYENAPPAFLAGQSQHRASLFDRAVQSFGGARNVAPEGSWLWFHATFWLGRSQLDNGNATEAIAEFQRLLEKDAEHHLAPAAIYWLGQAQIAAERHSQAVQTFKRLESSFGDLWSSQGKLGEGDANFAQKQYPQARAAYETADRGTRNSSIKRKAQVGIGKCYIADKRYDDAVRYFEQIINQPGGVDPEVGGGAWVGIGDCRFEQAKANGDDATKLKEALIAYQTASVRYAGVPGAYPRALFQSAVIYRKLNLPDLAKHQADELRSRCPKSPYVKQLP